MSRSFNKCFCSLICFSIILSIVDPSDICLSKYFHASDNAQCSVRLIMPFYSYRNLQKNLNNLHLPCLIMHIYFHNIMYVHQIGNRPCCCACVVKHFVCCEKLQELCPILSVSFHSLSHRLASLVA